jgi:hypothetical protein
MSRGSELSPLLAVGGCSGTAGGIAVNKLLHQYFASWEEGGEKKIRFTRILQPVSSLVRLT